MVPELPVAFEFVTPAAPVEAQGTVAGRPLYFHVRHDEWTFAVADAPGVDPADVDATAAPGRGWYREGVVPGRRAASFLPAAEAEAIIRACAAAYLAERRP